MDSERNGGLSRAFLERLDLELSQWHESLASGNGFPNLKVTIREFCQRVTHSEGISIGSEPDKLLGPRWEQNWQEYHQLPFGPLSQHNGLLTAQQERLLRDVQRCMVEFLLDGTTHPLQQRFATELQSAISLYLSTRGVNLHESGGVKGGSKLPPSPTERQHADSPMALVPRIHSLVSGKWDEWREVVRRWGNDPGRRGGDYGGLVVPFRDAPPLTRDERIVLLAAIHDCYGDGLEKIDPWPDDPPPLVYRPGAISYVVIQREVVPRLAERWESDGWKVERFLDELEAEAASSTPVRAVCDGESMTNAKTELDKPASLRLLDVFTGGLVDERYKKAESVLNDAALTANAKLTEIDRLLPFPATASAEVLAQLIGVSKTAVQKTDWWKAKRKGRKREDESRRLEVHQARALDRDWS